MSFWFSKRNLKFILHFSVLNFSKVRSHELCICTHTLFWTIHIDLNFFWKFSARVIFCTEKNLQWSLEKLACLPCTFYFVRYLCYLYFILLTERLLITNFDCNKNYGIVSYCTVTLMYKYLSSINCININFIVFILIH